MKTITPEQTAALVAAWKSRAAVQGYSKKKEKDARADFFAGAAYALSNQGLELPPYILICILTGRELP